MYIILYIYSNKIIFCSLIFLYEISYSFSFKNYLFSNTFYLQVNKKIIKAQIWDTAGQERYRAITSA